LVGKNQMKEIVCCFNLLLHLSEGRKGEREKRGKKKKVGSNERMKSV
jgi:hypothetical protein